MIDEQRLRAVIDANHRSDVACRPFDAVVARGERLRHRRRTLRKVGATAVVVGLTGAGLLVRAQMAPTDTGVRAVDTPTASAGGAEIPGPDTSSSPAECASTDTMPIDVVDPQGNAVPGMEGLGDTAYGAEPVAAADMPDELRVLPGWMPGGEAITMAEGRIWRSSCASTPENPLEDDLVWEVQVGGGHGAVQTGIECLVEARPRDDDAAPLGTSGEGDQVVTVNGEDAVWGPVPIGTVDAMALTWHLGPDATVQAGCFDWDTDQMLPVEDIVRLAESVVAVPADAARLAVGSATPD